MENAKNTPPLEQEVKELLDILLSVAHQECGSQDGGQVTFDSMAVSSRADVLKKLIQYGILEKVSGCGRSIVARLPDKTQNQKEEEPLRRQFSTGAVRNNSEGKGRYDLLPWEAIHEVAKHCEEGAKHYGERNCEKGIPISSLIDSATRHISCYMQGMDDENHLAAAAWNILFAIWTEIKKPEMQNIPARKEQNGDDCPVCGH